MHTRIDIDARPARRAIAGIGRVLLWQGGSLWIGRSAGRVQPHAHHAIQITLALGDGFLLRDGDGAGGWREHRGAIVMPHHPHQFDGCDDEVAQLFVEPETLHGRALVEQYGAAGITDLGDEQVRGLVAPLRRAYAARVDDAALVALAQHTIGAVAGPVAPANSVDPRISRAIDWLRQRLDAPISLADAARVAHLSPSRFRHLFVAQTGVSFRAYLLWARVGAAVGAAMGGQSWTDAAHGAGFADSAHLSRTCRRMFGIAPVTLLRE